MGCFTQDGKDSNKMYHAAVVKSKKDGTWYAYFEWGRTGAAKPSFQFVACGSEAEAQWEFASQLHSKNDRRGEWVQVAGIRTLRARAGQDCYLVRPMATRSTGLPDARSIKVNEGARLPASKNGEKTATKGSTGKAKKSKKPARKVDEPTWALLRDLAVATIAYTRGSMADASLPTQTAIDEARTILAEAQKRLAAVGDHVNKQVKDRELLQLTSLMYGRIPKKKALRAAPAEWILNQDNILAWQSDLDAFESALYATDIDHAAEIDPLEELQLTMAWVPPDSAVGKFLYEWWPQATASRHAYLGPMKIQSLWRVERHADQGLLPAVQEEFLTTKPVIEERPLFQPAKRADTKGAETKRFHASNTALLFHGTRSVNVRGILREALR
ncbi:MAG: WGR domain-containing protein, partial [Gemmataceae bacterium]|nr:WGR domain-containing protein [Gemmataceae bacterium]